LGKQFYEQVRQLAESLDRTIRQVDLKVGVIDSSLDEIAQVRKEIGKVEERLALLKGYPVYNYSNSVN